MLHCNMNRSDASAGGTFNSDWKSIMWAYTDEENAYLSLRAPNTGAADARTRAPTTARFSLRQFLPTRVNNWLKQRVDLWELRGMDGRGLSDLGINCGVFPAILAGTYSRAGAGVAAN